MMVLVSATACVQPSPTSHVLEARQAFARALEAEADRYTPDSLALASRVLDDAVEEVERQDRKPLWSRDYAHALALLGQARQLARGARYEARARRDQLASDAATILDEASRAIAKLEGEALAHAGGDAQQWSAWIRRFRAASDALAEARAEFRAGNYYDAHAHARQIVEELRELDNVSTSS